MELVRLLLNYAFIKETTFCYEVNGDNY